MNDGTISPYELRFPNELNQILPDVYDRIDDIEGLPESIGTKVLTVLVEFSCHSQNSTREMELVEAGQKSGEIG